jgi:hypothetical protein
MESRSIPGSELGQRPPFLAASTTVEEGNAVHTVAAAAERMWIKQETASLTLRVQSDALRLQKMQAQLQKPLCRVHRVPQGPPWLLASLARCVMSGPLFLLAASCITASHPCAHVPRTTGAEAHSH